MPDIGEKSTVRISSIRRFMWAGDTGAAITRSACGTMLQARPKGRQRRSELGRRAPGRGEREHRQQQRRRPLVEAVALIESDSPAAGPRPAPDGARAAAEAPHSAPQSARRTTRRRNRPTRSRPPPGSRSICRMKLSNPSRSSNRTRLPQSPASVKLSTRNVRASAFTVGRIHSQRPCRPGMSTSGGPFPTSIVGRIDFHSHTRQQFSTGHVGTSAHQHFCTLAHRHSSTSARRASVPQRSSPSSAYARCVPASSARHTG